MAALEGADSVQLLVLKPREPVGVEGISPVRPSRGWTAADAGVTVGGPEKRALARALEQGIQADQGWLAEPVDLYGLVVSSAKARYLITVSFYYGRVQAVQVDPLEKIHEDGRYGPPLRLRTDASPAPVFEKILNLHLNRRDRS
jgi:hypothetical protein